MKVSLCSSYSNMNLCHGSTVKSMRRDIKATMGLLLKDIRTIGSSVLSCLITNRPQRPQIRTTKPNRARPGMTARRTKIFFWSCRANDTRSNVTPSELGAFGWPLMIQKVIAGIMRDFFYETDSLLSREITVGQVQVKRRRSRTLRLGLPADFSTLGTRSACAQR
jgi:hypothetical protein